ncbi:Aspartyl-tRNA(Asn) amidotransferase subunit B @ Glutamyl-tRNA(Gln) amidotransferase subunit B, partial [hydrothermal vent metagenome]
NKMNQATKQKFETVIGLEVHLQLDTKTKIFCSCPNLFGQKPNSQTCPVCLGLPGSLPVVNQKTLEYAIKIGIALNCQINPYVKFDRKNYFYPDCPKAYQITQFDFPICTNGFLMVPTEDGKEKKIEINRGHLEEDAGKLIHSSDCSLVDYNRTGTPLLEIVTEPDLSSAQEAYDYLQILKLTLEYLNVSDCDMEKGSLRCDANISIRKQGATELGTKTELKNLNSFKAVKASIEFEINRQTNLALAGEKIIQETRLWDESKLITLSMRSKEQAHDYRYFPEPDLVPFTIAEETIENIKNAAQERPFEKLERLIKEYHLSNYDARILISDRQIADFFEECTKEYQDTKKICNWINGQLLQELKTRKMDLTDLNLSPKEFTNLIKKIDEDTISNLVAKDVLTCMLDTQKSAQHIIDEKGLAQVSDESSLESMVNEIINENPKV